MRPYSSHSHAPKNANLPKEKRLVHFLKPDTTDFFGNDVDCRTFQHLYALLAAAIKQCGLYKKNASITAQTLEITAIILPDLAIIHR